ncbi:F-box protein At3g54460 isoform X2 [Diospyros lotus]|uniref:F-box protein At3g54460 isoform X2 n=1 Tax=Diospyros lotus TaxID=55363 RepID=UPI00224D1B9B|nr:F-box protein At3g54460 isoform X2 [Diospyros lotus]XP_052193369.1 F-box protein At3g54460 isoform X2 [Diospyros lotus]
MEDLDDDPFPDHKLCAFLCAVLAMAPISDEGGDLCEILPLGARCHLLGGGSSEVGFRSENGVVLSLVNAGKNSESGRESVCWRKKKWRGVGGVVHGSVSVVRQLHALVQHKCLKVVAKVLRVLENDENCGDARVVLLVDVHLPIALWSGWQFPKSASVAAAALFRHLSCDWERRSSMLNSNGNVCKSDDEYVKCIWNLSDCHALGCKLQCSVPDASKRKLFELHEIFKSLPGVGGKANSDSSRVSPAATASGSGIWEVSDDVLIKILNVLCPIDLARVSATCRHLRFLAASVMPCMKLKLFPHQQAAIEWMLQREQDPELLSHPFYRDFLTDDGFGFYINTVSGEIVTGSIPTVRDFRGGMFCDEPGLGKTITALSLILKTQGTIAQPPDGVEVVWCMHNADKKCGYYELSGNNVATGDNTLSNKRVVGHHARRVHFSFDKFTLRENMTCSSLERVKFLDPVVPISGSTDLGNNSPAAACSTPATQVVRCTRSLSRIRRNLVNRYELASDLSKEWNVRKKSSKRKHALNGTRALDKSPALPFELAHDSKRPRKSTADHSEYNQTWVQCDACHKWRKLADASMADTATAWFCSMNTDPLHQSCSVPEESWDHHQSITYLPGFHTKGTPGGMEENVSFFTSVLKEHYALINSETKKALTWLAKLSADKLSGMETIGLVHPLLDTRVVSRGDEHEYHKIFQAFGLVKRVEKGTTRWYYPRIIENLVFDLAAFRVALCKPLDSLRLYLSRATLVVVPSNLVDHWKTQIQKHVRPGQLRVYIWTDHKKPCAHSLAWDYDIVLTTFTRLSAEWSPRKRSILMQVHWHRVMLDEGHTLGASLNLTNKLQMAISLIATNRWLLTGTPTPNTPNSQLSHLQPMLKFLHEEAYGQNQKSWEAGILRPFEAEMEEGRSRLLQLLHRCMISARKVDLQTIPPCIKKVTFLNFTEEHARSYNELVVTVRRNILMADWNDPSHVESLLNPKQWKFRSTTIRNVRLSCCVAGHIKVTDAGQDIQETMDILVENGLDPSSEEYAFIKYNLLYGGSCMRCKEWCRLPVITPCRHLLCLDCVALNSERCTSPGCDNSYEMQSPEILTRPENPNPKWPVPKDLIELQPSYKQDDWDPDWQSTSSSKVAYLVQRLKKLQEANKMVGFCIDEEIEAKHSKEFLCTDQKSDSCSLSHQEALSPQTTVSCKMLPDKVLIFSQFLEHIHVIEQQLTLAGIKFAGMYSPMHSSNKIKSLVTFQYDSSCMALLMDGSAALGLDLSFVTHVFLMEPIWDRSMEEQVISRAHRMGATRPIHVETLAMHGTVEEQMVRFLQLEDSNYFSAIILVVTTRMQTSAGSS